MKKSGYLYIAFNNGLLPNLFKIGISADDPKKGQRLTQLSRPTGVPSPFKLAYALQVQDMQKAENRVHLLLREYRFDKKKEFFLVRKAQAISIVNRVAQLLSYTPFPQLSIHDDFIFNRHFNKSLGGCFYNLLYMTLGYSHSNSFLDKLQGFPPDIVDGFLSIETVQKYRSVKSQQIRHQLKTFVTFAQDLTVSINDGEPLKIYKDIRYSRGEIAWIFHPRMKEMFIS